MKIKFLKAGHGESILINCDSHNIVIDGGSDSSSLLEEVKLILERGEVIDLLVITHHDDDHIRGIEDLLKFIDTLPNRNEFIKRVLFNSTESIKRASIEENDDSFLTYKQANRVESLINKFHLTSEACTNESPFIQYDNLKIEILSPLQVDLDSYCTAKGAYLSKDNRCDWDESLFNLEKYLDDESLDTDAINKTSIVLNLNYNNKNILLTGDVTPKRFEDIVNTMYRENDNKPVPFDLIKLPHHGSYRSLSKNILEKLTCSKFVICTNSKTHSFPNKRAILKVLKHIHRDKDNTIEFAFNYETALDNLKITSKEMKHYNFELISTNKDYYDISY